MKFKQDRKMRISSVSKLEFFLYALDPNNLSIRYIVNNLHAAANEYALDKMEVDATKFLTSRCLSFRYLLKVQDAT